MYTYDIRDCTTESLVLAMPFSVNFRQNDKNCIYKKTFCERYNKDGI